MRKAYELYEKWADMNTAYLVTLNCVADEIEKAIGNGTLHLPLEPTSRVSLVIEDGIITASYTTEPSIQIEITELSKNYTSTEERDAVYAQLESDSELTECLRRSGTIFKPPLLPVIKTIRGT